LAATLGLGCSALTDISSPVVSKTDTVKTPQLNLVPGSILVMRQGFAGIAGSLADKLGFGGGEGTRVIVIKRFAPGYTADIEWKLTTKVKKLTPKDSDLRQFSGSLSGVDLLRTHKLYLPGYWQEGEHGAFGTSALWVSEIVFEDLTKLKNTTLNFGILDQELYAGLKIAEDLKPVLRKLNVNIDLIGAHTDVYFMTAEPELTDWKLVVNGKTVTVQVIKARNWFGEIVVLNNKQNPLVLKVTLNPVGSNFLKNGLGYEITELRDVSN